MTTDERLALQKRLCEQRGLGWNYATDGGVIITTTGVVIDLWQEMGERRIDVACRVEDPTWYAVGCPSDVTSNIIESEYHDSPYDAVLELLVMIGERDV